MSDFRGHRGKGPGDPARAREPGQRQHRLGQPRPPAQGGDCAQTLGARPRCWGIQQCPRCRARVILEPRQGGGWAASRPEGGWGPGAALVLLPGHLQDKSHLGNKGPLPSPDPAVARARELGLQQVMGRGAGAGEAGLAGPDPHSDRAACNPPQRKRGARGWGGLGGQPQGPQWQGDGRHTPCPGLRTSWCPACCGASGHSGRWA